MELRGSKESSCVCLACVFLRLEGKRHRKRDKRLVNRESSLVENKTHGFGCEWSDHKVVSFLRYEIA